MAFCKQSPDEKKESRKAARRKYYLKNKQRIIDKSAEWQRNNREKASESSAKWQRLNPQRLAVWQKAYTDKNPLKIKMKYAKKSMPSSAPECLVEAKAMQLLIKQTLKDQYEQHN